MVKSIGFSDRLDVSEEEGRNQEWFLGCGLEEMVVPISGMERMEKEQFGNQRCREFL